MHSPYFRARYYDTHTAEFISPDPLEYVDGMSLFRGYFDLAYFDPTGTVIVEPVKPSRIGKGKCSTNFMQSWKFTLPKLSDLANERGQRGWLVQKVTVKCGIGTCRLNPGNGLTEWYWDYGIKPCPPSCECDSVDEKTFVYYEAWEVGGNATRPTNPPGMKATNYDDTADATPPANTCGKYEQQGELRYYLEIGIGGIGDLSRDPRWSRNAGYFGKDTKCPTTARDLLAFDGTNETPGFWIDSTRVVSTGERDFSVSWNCCAECPKRLWFAEASANPSGD